MQAILRHLDNYRILDAGLWIDPEIRRNLAAAGKSQEHVIDDILLGQREFLSLEPVYIKLDLRRVHGLLHEHIGGARNILDLLLKLGRDLMSRVRILSADLNVNRRRHSKVESLIRDIGRLEKKRLLGKLLCEIFPQNSHPLLRGPMLPGERYQDVSVAVTRGVTG
jgi:hypothetical protein